MAASLCVARTLGSVEMGDGGTSSREAGVFGGWSWLSVPFFESCPTAEDGMEMREMRFEGLDT